MDQIVADPSEREVVAAETGLLHVTDVGSAADLHLRPVDEHRDGGRTDAFEVGCLRFNPHIDLQRYADDYRGGERSERGDRGEYRGGERTERGSERPSEPSHREDRPDRSDTGEDREVPREG